MRKFFGLYGDLIRWRSLGYWFPSCLNGSTPGRRDMAGALAEIWAALRLPCGRSLRRTEKQSRNRFVNRGSGDCPHAPLGVWLFVRLYGVQHYRTFQHICRSSNPRVPSVK